MKEECMEFKIIYEDNTELAEFEALNKSYRKDVIVVIGEKRYKLYITSMLRLQQDFELAQEVYGYCPVEPNILLVNEVTKTEIEKIITKMYHNKYFERLDNKGFEVEEDKFFE